MTRHPRSVALASGLMLAVLGCGGSANPGDGPTPREVDIGYGTQPEGEVTGAVTSVRDTDPASTGPLTVEELLRGRVAGLQVIRTGDGGVAFQIRGTDSLESGRPALVLVDGVEIRPREIVSALAGLTRDQIKQVDVLRDVASTSIYGTRGSGGVILITTAR